MEAEIQFDVTAVNDAPEAAGQILNINENTIHTFSAADFGYSDVDGDTLVSVVVDTLPAAGSFQLSGVDVTLNQIIAVADIPDLTFTPVTDAFGADYARIGYRVNDGTDNSLATVEIQFDVADVVAGPAYELSLTEGDLTYHLIEPSSTDDGIFYVLDANDDDQIMPDDKQMAAELDQWMPSASTFEVDGITLSLVNEQDLMDIGYLTDELQGNTFWVEGSSIDSYVLVGGDTAEIESGYLVYQVIA